MNQGKRNKNQVINGNIDTIMELHKHSFKLWHNKKLGEYLLEFFMLFLAIFLGFIAENIRENHVERHREKHYIKSMINDLKTDTLELGKNIIQFQKLLKMQDTLIKMYPQMKNGFKVCFFVNLKGVDRYPDFIYTDGTIQQLKNSGGFRLIEDNSVVDSIMTYDALVRNALLNEAVLGRLLEKMKEEETEIFDQQKLNEEFSKGKTLQQLEGEYIDYLLTHDKITISRYYNKILLYNRLCIIIEKNMKRVKYSATALISYLKTEYHLQDI